MKKLFAVDVQGVALYLSKEDAPKFDSRFVALGFGVDHEVFMKALHEHLDELNEYGAVEVTEDHAMMNVVQAVGLRGYVKGFDLTSTHNSFLTKLERDKKRFRLCQSSSCQWAIGVSFLIYEWISDLTTILGGQRGSFKSICCVAR